MVGQADLPWVRDRAADQAGIGDGVVRRAERTDGDEGSGDPHLGAGRLPIQLAACQCLSGWISACVGIPGSPGSSLAVVSPDLLAGLQRGSEHCFAAPPVRMAIGQQIVAAT
jgi:hypothetical protein